MLFYWYCYFSKFLPIWSRSSPACLKMTFVKMSGQKSQWHTQQNRLPPGSGQSPRLFNTYTDYKEEFPNMWRFIYLDYLSITIHSERFEDIKLILTGSLYLENTILLGPWVSTLARHKCSPFTWNTTIRPSKNSWYQGIFEHYEHPVYSGVT